MAFTYRPRDFDHLIGMQGFSETLLKNHFTLYQGYVNNTNKLLELLADKPKDGKNPEFAEIKRRFAFEFNGMRLHEYYFENLGGEGSHDRAHLLARQFQDGFGGFDRWMQDFRATGGMRGVGWSILYRDNVTGALCNAWITEHQDNHLVGCSPLLVMDMWEHAFMLDHGLDKAAYMDAFMRNVNWEIVESRFVAAVQSETKARTAAA